MVHIAYTVIQLYISMGHPLLLSVKSFLTPGSHDLLYQEFLPLLSNLLQGLNHLQSGVHKQYMKDLFVELYLTCTCSS